MQNIDTITPNPIYQQVEKKVITLRGEHVILDCDLATLYGVETKRINEAVKNNPDKFPTGYCFEVPIKEIEANLKSKLSTSSWGGTRKPATAFTERGLYMMATILKSKQATQTTLAIVEAYAHLRSLARTVSQLSATDEPPKQKELAQRSSELFTELLGEDLFTSESETTFKLNFAVLSLEHTVKRKKKEE